MQPLASVAAGKEASYDFKFCFNEAEDFASRALNYEDCLLGSKEITREQWMDIRLKAKQLTKSDYQLYKNSTPDKMDAGLVAESNGTAFAVNDKGFLVTSNHVTGHCEKVVLISEVDLVLVNIVAASVEDDIAILSSKYIPKGVAKIREAPLELGEPIYAFGFPYITTLRALNMTSGIVSGVQAMGSPSLVQLSTPLQPGNSGGPIVDEYGVVAGVVAARLREGQNIGFGLQGKILRRFLNDNKVDYTLVTATDIMPTKEMAKSASSYTIPLFCLVEDN
jgi:S1-C subfamily serine protease